MATAPGGLKEGAAALGVPLDAAQLRLFARYRASLENWNLRLNLTSAAALADIERSHFLDALTLVPYLRTLPAGARLVDIGSGAGFPGVPLKLALPGIELALVEATAKKAGFLRWLVNELGLSGVTVHNRRAEELAHDPELRERFDAATARALGALPTVLELTLPFLRVGGVLLAQRGTDGPAEASSVTAAAEVLGGQVRAVEKAGEPRWVVLVDKVSPIDLRYPRRSGMPVKYPLR